MKKLFTLFGLCALVAFGAIGAQAAATDKPVIHKQSFTDNGIAQKMSDNGRWVLISGGSDDTSGAAQRIVDMDSNETTEIMTASEISTLGSGSFSDVTDDGNILVGSHRGQPAYFNRTTREWTTLPLPSGVSGGGILSVTPDGHYAVGSYSYRNEYQSSGGMWDLTTNSIVELTNLPTLDMQHEDNKQQDLIDISSDGRYILGMLSYSYLQPIGVCSFIYDVQNQSYKFLGFNSSDTEPWTPLFDGLYFVGDPYFSPNGKWVAASAYMVKEQEGSEWPTEYYTICVYNVETGEFTVYDDNESHGMMPGQIDNEGTVYGATPANSTPLRNWMVRYNGYWYTFKQILSQAYGIDFEARTGYENTGTPMSISSDAKRMVVMVDPTSDSYILDLPEKAVDICANIDLLSNYTVSPASGSTFSALTTLTLTFDRNVKVTGQSTAVKLKDAAGNVLMSSNAFTTESNDSKVVSIRFRGKMLEEGQQYTVSIPAGTIVLSGDNSKKNKAIDIVYNGRANVPVTASSVYPADNSQLAKIDNSSTFVVLSYDINVAKTDSAAAWLINATSGDTITTLNVAISGKQVGLYPSATQYLYDGQNYVVKLKAGSITDLSGRGGNEELTLNYAGTYVRTVSHDDDNLFSEDFDNVSQAYYNFMRYEGDHNTPTSEMKAWTFDADNMPWNFSLRDNSTSTNYCAASHSMYDPAGQSDDWMVIPQLDIPDEFCNLTFLAQSYLMSKNDTLRVVVWEHDANINYLTSDIIEQMKAEGKVVFEEKLSPGLSQDELDDDWTSYAISLKEFAGKKVYIGFWNHNTNQSAIFVDSVMVKRNLKYLMALSNEESVVAKDDIAIKGRITINSDIDTYSSVTLTLCDAAGNTLDTYSESGLSLKKNDYLNFAFTKTLPLTIGETNKFSIKVQLDDYNDVVNSTVKDLSFQPTKRVVLEEFTGMTCVNCPLGILGVEHLKAIYGDQFIPVSIHTYDGDALATNQLNSYTSYLGLSGAPTGRINRAEAISAPMWTNPATFSYDFSNGATLWSDLVAAEMQVPADMDVNASVKLDIDNGTFNVPFTVRSALNAKNQMINVFAVVLEDSVSGYQENGYGSIADPNLGEWGKGGLYSAAINYGYNHDDVARYCYGSTWTGTQGLLPQTYEVGTDYEATLTNLTIPENVKTLRNAKVVIMLIDANTEKVINAAVAKFSDDPTGITNASIDNAKVVATTYYDMSGRPVNKLGKGLYVKVSKLSDGTVKTTKTVIR